VARVRIWSDWFIDLHYHSRSQKTIPSSADYVWRLCFYVGTMQRICLFSDCFYSDSNPFLTARAI
jgi:hypothetical protein